MNRNEFRKKLSGLFETDGIMLIMTAYDLSKAAHRNQEREEFPATAPIKDKRYFNHPRHLAIEMIDAGIRDVDLICIALLHDCSEDTSIFGNQKVDGYDQAMVDARFRLTRMFNKTITEAVIALTIPMVDTTNDLFSTKTKCTIFGHEKLENASLKALIGKLFDRLHNLSSIEVKSKATAKLKILETIDFYIPLFDKALNDSYPSDIKKIGLQKTEQLKELVSKKLELLG